MDHDEDVHTASASGEEDAYTGTEVDISMDRVIDEDRQIESRMDKSFDSDTDSYDSLNYFIVEMELFDLRIEFEMEEIDSYFDYMDFLDKCIDETLIDHRIMDEDMDYFHLLNDKIDRLSESDMEESIDTDTDTDEHDSTGKLEDEISRALSQMASSLCLICRDLARGIFRLVETEYLTHHLSLSLLRRSVDDGCRLCMALAESLEHFCKKSDPPVNQKEFWSIKGAILEESSGGSELWLRFLLCQCEHDHPYGAICQQSSLLRDFCFYPAHKLCLGPEFLNLELRTSSAESATSLAVARSWYQQCLNHAICRNWRQESRFLPTRLVEIWKPDNQSADLSAKICETKYLPITTSYVTLSHCWGKSVIFKLLQDNLRELSQAIPIGQLPKVFQDAIYVAYELGINYIWIDSLCIIQDSKEDWTYEAKRMGGVYSNGEFNIAATGYEDGLSGLFGERMALSVQHVPMRMRCELINEDYQTEAVFEGLYVAVSHHEISKQVIFSPLNNRGWVAQERTLSPAIIHYTPEKMYWECNQCIASEAFPNGCKIWDDTEGTGRARIRSLSKKSQREDVYTFWRTFLVRYAGMAMTFNQDRFPAVAGIARILGELIDDNFVAGFWEGDLVRSLVLQRLVHPRNSIVPEQLAPSWSWASLKADTRLTYVDASTLEPFNGVRFTVLSDIPGFKTDLQSPSFEKSGVCGLAIKGVLRKLPDDFDKQKEWVVSADMVYDNRDPVKYLGDRIPQDQAWRFNDPTHMLLLARRPDTGSYFHVHGLMVQLTELDEANTFRRSGSIELCFHTRAKCDEYLGLRQEDGEYKLSPLCEQSGLQDLILI